MLGQQRATTGDFTMDAAQHRLDKNIQIVNCIFNKLEDCPLMI